MESATGDKRKGPPLPPIKGDGSVDYDGELMFGRVISVNFTFLFLANYTKLQSCARL